MKRSEQAKVNAICNEKFNQAVDQCARTSARERLRSCTAWVYETADYFVLQSYNTLIACIEKATDTCYDVLRTEYGYTSTSAQHISKFRKDCGNGKWGCEHCLTAR